MNISGFLRTLLPMFTVMGSAAHGASVEVQAREKAALAVSLFQERAGGRLDYSEQSLAVVEEMLAEASAYLQQIPPKDIDALVNLMGSYVLEVGHRQFGGAYQWHDAANQPVLVVGQPASSVAIMPFDKIRSRLSGDEADNIVFFYQGFAERARTAAPGTKALYL